MATASSSEIAYATRVGSKSTLPNGDISYVSRHESSKDHVIRVTVRNNKVREATVQHEPLNIVTMRQRKEAGEAKAKADKSKANRAAQLAKKRLRTPPPKNKK